MCRSKIVFSVDKSAFVGRLKKFFKMISELVVSASLLMLSAAQHIQIPPYHVVQLPNLQPAQLPSVPNSQLFMIQRANTILGEDIGSPLDPGMLTAPISVSQTAQNILNQGSQVVGYNLQNGVSQVIQQQLHHHHHQQQQPLPQQSFVPFQGGQFVTLNAPHQVNQAFLPNIPKMIHVTAADAIGNDKRVQIGKYKSAPQSFSLPVLNSVDNRHVVDLPARASIKTLFRPEKQYKDAPYFTFKNKPLARVQLQDLKYASNSFQRQSSTRSNSNNHANLYDDIPANHPIPPPPRPPTNHVHYTPETTNFYENRPPNHQVSPPSQVQRNPIRYNPETTNLYEDRSPNHPVPPPPQQQINPIRYTPESTKPYEDRSPNHSVPQPQAQTIPHITNVYYDIPPNHPVPPPPSESNKNTFDEINLIQRLKQASSDVPVQALLSPTKDFTGEYAPARPPPVLPGQNSFLEQSKEDEIINMMPPMPYREEQRHEQRENFNEPSIPLPQTQPQSDINPSEALSNAMKNVLPSLVEVESSKAEAESGEQTTTERIQPTTYRPTESEKEEYEKPKKTSSGKSRLHSKGTGSSNPDSETSHSENFYQQAPAYQQALAYQQAPAYQNAEYSNGGNGGGHSYNRESYSSPNPDSSHNHYSSPNNDVVHKHIFVHAAPDAYQSHAPRVRVIRPQYNNEKHVNIIFVKSPTPPPEQTIVELPPRDQPKTFVYVLSKQPQEGNSNVKILAPPKSKPQPPEIFFIRYGANNGGNKGYPVPNLQSLYDNYGALSNPQPQVHEQPQQQSQQHPQQQSQLEFDRPPSGLVPPRPLFRRGLRYRNKRNKDYGLDVYAPLMSYSSTGQINEMTQEEADTRKTKLDDFF